MPTRYAMPSSGLLRQRQRQRRKECLNARDAVDLAIYSSSALPTDSLDACLDLKDGREAENELPSDDLHFKQDVGHFRPNVSVCSSLPFPLHWQLLSGWSDIPAAHFRLRLVRPVSRHCSGCSPLSLSLSFAYSLREAASLCSSLCSWKSAAALTHH